MCFFIKNFYDDNKKKYYLYDKFLRQIKILLLNMLKMSKGPGFSRFNSKFLKFYVFLCFFLKQSILFHTFKNKKINVTFYKLYNLGLLNTINKMTLKNIVEENTFWF